ncbi:general secretion pathway protein GspL [Pseudomonas gingeri]|uniref:Type II secretion system protein L n=1 Tax=Pseudomonas gingeri TaxID=117681 RepID=A0A7Y7XCE4_9PSED|nr:type II secretion system protein GspL [Pseudomonas gingeri]NWB97328.1 general secretion pathway protein GspL [Pseudomonas gingeri]
MSNWLYLTAKGLAACDATWPVGYWQAGGEYRRITLAEAATFLAGQSVRVILPMEICSHLRSEPWPGRRKPTIQALAYAVEDRLAEDLDGLHIAVGVASNESRYPLLAINKQRFKAILALLQGLGLQVVSVKVDADLLPDHQAYGVWWAGRWLLGGAIEARLALSPEDLEVLRPRLPEALCWMDADRQGDIAALLMAGHPGALDLLQGEFRQVRARWPWGTLVVSALALFALSWGFTLARAHYLESAAQQLYEQSVQRFQHLYPEQTRIVDLSAQLKALQGRSEQSDSQMGRLLQLIEQVVGGSRVEVQRIEYRAGTGWTLLLTAGSFSELEGLRERGHGSGLPIRLGSASKDRERVQAVLVLEEKNG